MKIVIVEDELHNRRMLEGMLQQLRPGWSVTDAFESVKETVEWLQGNAAPDLIFMDIQLVDGICFSIFEQVEVKSMVIFTTAYDEYAIQAFKVNSVDYLLKPIKETDLESAILKFESYKQILDKSETKPDYADILNAIRNGEKKYRQRFLVAGADSYFKLDAKDIAYFYSENKVTFAVTFAGKEHIIDLSLDKLQDEIDPHLFFRANRQAIISIESVWKAETYFGGKLIVKLTSPLNQKITVSRLKATAFKKWVDQ